MNFSFAKYHALRNDFMVVDAGNRRLPRPALSRLAIATCDRRAGIGADGLLYLSSSNRADRKIDVFNADGSWAEKSGNGLRIGGVHLKLSGHRKRVVTLESAGAIHDVRIDRRVGNAFSVTTDLGPPVFETSAIPVKSRHRFMIHGLLKIGGTELPITCLSVGNPHAVLFVDSFDFDWRTLGHDIEHHPFFTDRTNVEFVKVINSRRLKVVDWERGVGPTPSSGTGAAAALSAAVMMGMVKRRCRVVFNSGTIEVEWDDATNRISICGPVEFICKGEFRCQ
ncbi:MAG: diaminopimelate epimerase [Candidatus Zixiibacteriota bacterium]